jgi:DNA invertase Pin-like site-specific DNA recombinase
MDLSGVERSISEQQDQNRGECESNNWQVTAKYTDAVGASRFTRKQREDWPRLQADIEHDHLDVIVIWEPSRGSREPEDWFAFLRRCRDHHVRIHVTTHERTYDMKVARDWKQLADDGIDSAYEVEKLSGRVKRGLAANRANGRPHGRIQYGFQREYGIGKGKDGRTVRVLKRQYPDPEQAAVCAEIIRRVASAEPLTVIEASLNERGIPSATGSKWSRHQIRAIATNPAYIGKLWNGGELVDAIWPAIVDEATFEATFWAACRHVTAPERMTTKPGKAKWLASYIATCGGTKPDGTVCGAPLYVQAPTGRHKHPYYACSGPGKHVALNVAVMDRLMELVIFERCKQPDIYARVVEGSDEQVMEARNEAARLRAQLDEWAAADISARAYQIKEAKLVPLIEAAEKRAVQLTVPLPLRELVEPGADVAARWKALSVAAQREVVRLLVTPLRLMPAMQDGVRVPAEDRIKFPKAADDSLRS